MGETMLNSSQEYHRICHVGSCFHLDRDSRDSRKMFKPLADRAFIGSLETRSYIPVSIRV